MDGLQIRTLNQVLDEEKAAVAAGTPVCGADHFGQPDGVTCMRIATHATDGQQARESHAFQVNDPPALYWMTWQNVQ